MKSGYFLIIWISTLCCLKCETQLKIANLEISFYKKNARNGKFRLDSSAKDLILEGRFSPAGPVRDVEGPIYQIQIQVCQKDDTLSSYGDYHEGLGWVGYTKLEPHVQGPHACDVYERAQQAFERGAMAMIFDVTDNAADTERLVRTKQVVNEPIIMIRDEAAEAFNNQVILKDFSRKHGPKEAHGRILVKDERRTRYVTNGNLIKFIIFVVLVIAIISVVVTIVVCKYPCHWRPHEMSLEDHTKRLLRDMKTRRYENEKSLYSLGTAPIRSNSILSGFSTDSTTDSCAICLSTYKHDEELRVLPCMHEFHKFCVDPWLIKNQTCPLCLYNILEPESPKSRSSQHRSSSHVSNSIPTPHSNSLASPSNRGRYNNNSVYEHYMYERVPQSENYPHYSSQINTARFDLLNRNNRQGTVQMHPSDRQLYTTRRSLPYVNTFIPSCSPSIASHSSILQPLQCNNGFVSPARSTRSAFYPVTSTVQYPASLFSKADSTNFRPPPQRCKRVSRKPARPLRDLRMSLSSESEVEFAKSLRSSIARSMRSGGTRAHLPDLKHHTDADVSETSGADLDSDGQGKLSDSSRGDSTSNHGTFGSSKVATESSGSSQRQARPANEFHSLQSHVTFSPAREPAYVTKLASPHSHRASGSPVRCQTHVTESTSVASPAIPLLPTCFRYVHSFPPASSAFTPGGSIHTDDVRKPAAHCRNLPTGCTDLPVDCKEQSFHGIHLPTEWDKNPISADSNAFVRTHFDSQQGSLQPLPQSLENAPTLLCDVTIGNLPPVSSGIICNAASLNETSPTLYLPPTTSSPPNYSSYTRTLLKSPPSVKVHPDVDKLKSCMYYTDSDNSLTSVETLGVSPVVSDFPASANSGSETSADTEVFCQCEECACARESATSGLCRAAGQQAGVDPTSFFCTRALENESVLNSSDNKETETSFRSSPCIVKSLSDNSAFMYSSSGEHMQGKQMFTNFKKFQERLKERPAVRRSAFRPYRSPITGSVQNHPVKSYYIPSGGRSHDSGMSRDTREITPRNEKESSPQKGLCEESTVGDEFALTSERNFNLPDLLCLEQSGYSQSSGEIPPPVPPRRTSASLSVNVSEFPIPVHKRHGGHANKRNVHSKMGLLLPETTNSPAWNDQLLERGDKGVGNRRRNTIPAEEEGQKAKYVTSPTTSMVIFSEGGFVTVPVKAEHPKSF